jgi:hypothetical protein
MHDAALSSKSGTESWTPLTGLSKLGNGMWVIDQIAGPCNHAVPRVVHADAHAWVRKAVQPPQPWDCLQNPAKPDTS